MPSSAHNPERVDGWFHRSTTTRALLQLAAFPQPGISSTDAPKLIRLFAVWHLEQITGEGGATPRHSGARGSLPLRP